MNKITLGVLISLILLSSIFAITNEGETSLLSGKNNITTAESFKPTYVEDFVKKYPNIQVISYQKENKTIGYVNTFGGIGENFIMYPNTDYEIITKINTTVIVQ